MAQHTGGDLGKLSPALKGWSVVAPQQEKKLGQVASLTDKNIAALGHFAHSGIKTAAYRHAYNCSGMTARTVNRRALEVFAKPLMKSAVDNMRAVAAAKCKVDAQWVLHRARLLADFNLQKFLYIDDIDEDGEQGSGGAFYDFTLATEDDWYCISEYCVDIVQKGSGMDKYEAERVKIKSESRLKALEMVAKLGGMQGYNNKLEVELAGHMLTSVSTAEYVEARKELIALDDC